MRERGVLFFHRSTFDLLNKFDFQKYHLIYYCFIINEQSIADIIGLEGVLG